MQDLRGYVALVTGGNGGIGLGMAAGMAAAGADIVIWGRNPDKNAAAEAQLRATGVRVLAAEVDVSDEDAVTDGFAAAVAAMGKVDAVFANAGRPDIPKPFWQLTLDEWRSVTAVNLDGVFLCFREGARHMIERGEGGSLVAVSSTSAIHGAAFTPAYGTAKTGLLGMTRALAVLLARHRIRVNAVLPGWTMTDMLEPGLENEKFATAIHTRTPVRRFADPAEFGPVACFLADPRLTFHTGDDMVVDGAYTIF